MHLFRNPLSLLVITSTFLTGCGSAAYETQFQKTLDAKRRETPFHKLFQTPVIIPIEQSEDVLSFRLPEFFDKQSGEAYALEGKALPRFDVRLLKLFGTTGRGLAKQIPDALPPDPRDPEQSLELERLLPSFLRVGDHLRTYEVTLDYQDGQQRIDRGPLRCYFLVLPTDDLSISELKKQIATNLEKAFPAKLAQTSQQKRNRPGVQLGVTDWVDLNIPTPDGETLSVQKITAEGNHQFQYYKNNRKPTMIVKNKPAKCLVYLVPTPKFNVVIAWLTTLDLAQQLHLDGSEKDQSIGSPRAGQNKQRRSTKTKPVGLDYPIAPAIAGSVQVLPAEPATE